LETQTLRSILVRFVCSSRYKERLTGYATAFADGKKELGFLTETHTGVVVTQISNQMDQVLAFIADVKSQKEKKVQDLVAAGGGTEAVIKVK
jgi:hypothetical protein